jgi:hypothetical protein
MMDNIKNLKNLKICHLLVELNNLNPNTLLYSRKLQDGSGPSSYGILVCEAMNIDPKFTQRAKEIRNNICNNVMKINNIGSKYNKDKVIAQCEICNEANACDVHHINQQCDANDCDLIDDIEIGIFNKNKLWNLVSLCKMCHQSVHSSPPRIKIDGYITTSSGVRLVFERLDKSGKADAEVDAEVDAGGNSDKECDINVVDDIVVNVDNSDCDCDSDYDIKGDNDDIIVNEMYNKTKNNKTKNNKNIKNKKVLASAVVELSDEIKKVILDMKNNNATPKKIQFDMMRYHQVKISQQDIRDLHS